ncbi:MAG: Glycosyl transferase family 2, partial [candidate division WWE3 bacterium GW2011_GWA1_41_8]
MRSANTPQITSHTLVKNEARFVWYSVMSVIEYVDHVLLWDTGSADGTVEILKRIKELYPAKVDLRLLGEIDIYSFAKIRQEMLDNTKTEWLLVNDGDEVWWEES